MTFVRACGLSELEEDTPKRVELDGTPVDRNVMRNYIPREWMKEFVQRVEVARETVGPDVDIIMENHCITNQ